MKLNRTLSLCLTLVICAGLAIGGTLAYYTDQEKVTNTFNLSEGVDITLTEAEVVKPDDGDDWTTTDKRTEEGNVYQGIYPGAVLPKDPTITLAENSDDAYVRVKVTVEDAFDWHAVYTDSYNPEGFFMQLINNTLGEGWEVTDCNVLMSGADRDTSDLEYTLTYTERLSAGESTTPVFSEIVFSPKFDAELIKTFFGDGKSFNVDVIGEAIQAATFDSAMEAFANYDGTAWTADTSWYTGTEKTYTLNTAGELAGLAQLVNAGTSFKGITVKLGADIDLHNIAWTPIGKNVNNNTKFQGAFDGEGHTVYNLKVAGDKGVGLFGWVFTGSVKNVNVVNAEVNGTSYAAAVVGHSYGHVSGCTVENAKINCVDLAGEDGNYAGSIVGFTPADVKYNVTDNTAKNVTITANRGAGAIIGYAKTGVTTLANNTFENVTVTHSGYGSGEYISNGEVGRK